MTLPKLETLTIDTTISNEPGEYSIPLNITDIISICKDFNNLGWQVQKQVETILEVGVEEALLTGKVKLEVIPHIKYFLHRVCDNIYFGDAAFQAQECLELIAQYEDKYPILNKTN